MNQSTIYLKTLLQYNDRLIVACSGGPDSMALVSLLCELKEELNLYIALAHVNHKVRKEADIEEEYVKDYANQHNLAFFSLHLDPIKNNFEQTAREKRYQFFNELITKYHAKYLMTAHHGDDLTETILMRLNRGSTLRGYAGFDLITKKDNYYLVHPLIFTDKQEIISYLEKKHIKYFIDQTNLEDIHTRNRYRKTILPFLKKENLHSNQKFLEFSNRLKKADDFINNYANKIFHLAYNNNEFSLSYYYEEDSLIQEYLIELLFKSLYINDLYLITNKNSIELQKLINSKKPNTTLHLPNNHQITKNYDKLFVDKIILKSNVKESLKEINIYNNQKIELIASSLDTSNYVTRLSKEELNLPLYIRTRKPKDKVAIKNLNGHKKLKDIFIDCKIPIEDRANWLVVVDSKDNIIWLPGLKKTKFDKEITEKYDIILKYTKEGEKKIWIEKKKK